MKKHRLSLSFLAAIITAAGCTLICWLSGFNFDHRDPNVAAGFCTCAMLTGMAFVMTFISPYFDDQKS